MKRICFALALTLSLFSQVSSAAAFTSNDPHYVTRIYTIPFASMTDRIYVRLTAPQVNNDGCNGSFFYAMEVGTTFYKENLMLISMAAAAQLPIRVYVDGCTDGNAYPLITRVIVNPPVPA